MNWDSFYPPLAGSFLGVLLGILANHFYQIYIADENKKKYKKMIKSEIELCINLLEREFVQFLPVDQWSSAVNSGALKLFEVEKELGPLSIGYQRIRDYDHFITTEQIIGINWEGIDNLISSAHTKPGLKFNLDKLKIYRTALLEELRTLNNAEWLNPSNKPAPGYNDALRYEENARH